MGQRRRSAEPDLPPVAGRFGSTSTIHRVVCEKFELCVKFMQPPESGEAIIVKRIDRSEHFEAGDDRNPLRRISTGDSCLVPNAVW
jgi:hypothetical protein